MVDIGKTIDALEDVSIGINEEHIENAVKVLRMYRRLRNACRNYDIGQVTKLQMTRILDDIEEEFFPSYITKTIKVNVKVRTDEGLARVYQIKNCIETYAKERFLDVEEVIYE